MVISEGRPPFGVSSRCEAVEREAGLIVVCRWSFEYEGKFPETQRLVGKFKGWVVKHDINYDYTSFISDNSHLPPDPVRVANEGL